MTRYNMEKWNKIKKWWNDLSRSHKCAMFYSGFCILTFIFIVVIDKVAVSMFTKNIGTMFTLSFFLAFVMGSFHLIKDFQNRYPKD